MKLFLDASFIIYLNTVVTGDRDSIDGLLKRILTEELYTNLLVIDETLYISLRKYKVPYATTMSFFEEVILPYTEVVPIDENDIENLQRFLTKYDMKPSDSIHLSSMGKKGVNSIVSEDTAFDRVEGINRVWL